MQVKFPIWLKVEARELEDESWEMIYEEGFRDVDREAFSSSAEAFKKAMETVKGIEVDVELKQSSVGFRLRGPRQAVYNALAGEFLMCSELGSTTLSELLITVLFQGFRGGEK